MDPKILKDDKIEQCFSDSDWSMEIKYSGRRIQCLIDNKKEVSFAGRYGRDASENISDFRWKFSKIYEDIKAMHLPTGTLLDGEVYSKISPSITYQMVNSSVDDSIQLQKKYGFLTYVLFDLIYCNTASFENYANKFRQQKLRQIIKPTMNVELSEVWTNVKDKTKIWNEILNSTQEEKGVVFKLSDSTYQFARSSNWLKHKQVKTYDAVIMSVKLDKNDLATSVEVGQYKGKRLVKVANVSLSTKEQKEDFACNNHTGKVIEFNATSKTGKSYKNPIAVANCLRRDKNPESCVWRE